MEDRVESVSENKKWEENLASKNMQTFPWGSLNEKMAN